MFSDLQHILHCFSVTFLDLLCSKKRLCSCGLLFGLKKTKQKKKSDKIKLLQEAINSDFLLQSASKPWPLNEA